MQTLIVLGFFSCILAELIGYLLHRLLHSGKIQWLSHNHMWHHEHDYPAGGRMRTEKYISGAAQRFNVAGIGLEWLIPSVIMLVFLIGIFTLIGVSAVHQTIILGIVTIWSTTMFNYMHDAMHRKNFWMLKVPLLKRWFKRARRLHDIHHVDMTANFGICFFWFDEVFNTLKKTLS